MKVFYKEDERVIYTVKENYGVTYIIFKGVIDITKSFPFEANSEGRCIGFDVPEDLDLKEFDDALKRFAREKGFLVTGEKSDYC
ncbi:MAG TPA: hypothetical protein ENH97_03090 [bacterium]|nr:hypothetical protein [bacterium]